MNKQQLLARYRRRKRQLMLAGAVPALLLAGLGWPGWALLLLGLAWVIHEAWLADHLFYDPATDYGYRFPDDSPAVPVALVEGTLQLAGELPAGETLILPVRFHADWRGRLWDPHVLIGADRQDLERGCVGWRYLNLSGQRAALQAGQLSLRARYGRILELGPLQVFDAPDYGSRRLLLIAPHADDAELAAFGLYSRAADVHILTLTQGEIEADRYQALGLDAEAAAKLKGRLRSWDSLAIPLWGGVPQQRCLQLGYFCLQLGAMQASPQTPQGSRESGEISTLSARCHNPWPLPGDADGHPTWQNLQADLRAILERIQPEVIVTPHPQLDPHPDHVAATEAVLEALRSSALAAPTLLLYANHLADNDRWPMGPAGCGTALPPAFGQLPADALWSPSLSTELQLDKAQALAMQHDLQGSLSLKQRLRRSLQCWLVRRQHPATGDNAFFRKGVRRHELFWVRSPASADDKLM